METYLDGELDPSQVIEVESHTRTCSKCSERVMLDRAIRTGIRRRVSAAQPPTELHERIVAAMMEERAHHRLAGPVGTSRLASPRSVTGWMLVAAAAAAAAIPVWRKTHTDDVAATAVSKMATVEANGGNVDIDTMINELVDWHARPLPPEITDARDLSSFEPYVGVPVHAPPLPSPFGARWLGGRILPVVNQSVTAMLQYTIQNGHRLSVYVYDPRRIRVQPSSLKPHVIGKNGSAPVYMGRVRGYSFAAAERRGVGYAIASDLEDEDSAEVTLALAQ